LRGVKLELFSLSKKFSVLGAAVVEVALVVNLSPIVGLLNDVRRLCVCFCDSGVMFLNSMVHPCKYLLQIYVKFSLN